MASFSSGSGSIPEMAFTFFSSEGHYSTLAWRRACTLLIYFLSCAGINYQSVLITAGFQKIKNGS